MIHMIAKSHFAVAAENLEVIGEGFGSSRLVTHG
jgi:hypothetical protein